MDVDFVVLWVDDSDVSWINCRNKWASQYGKDVLDESRFRDWDLFRYWFRTVEKFTPWVRKIHLVTCGHHPAWLNLNNEKLNLVKHSDFIPADCLPTFNSNAIEVGIHNIPSLAEKFVLFNDDMYVLQGLKKDFFFAPDGKPCDRLIQNALCPENKIIFHTRFNNTSVINRIYSKNQSTKANFSSYFSTKYGKDFLRNVALIPWKKYSGFVDDHLPVAYSKSSFENMWEKAFDELNSTMHEKFRSIRDVSHWMIRYSQLVSGTFKPCRSRGRFFQLGSESSVMDVVKVVENQNYPMVCINDSSMICDFEKAKKNIRAAFEKILSSKSSFEL